MDGVVLDAVVVGLGDSVNNSEYGQSDTTESRTADDAARANAQVSVVALLEDLRHVVGRMSHVEWPAMARKVLEHHDPPVATDLLSPDEAGLQDACRHTLDALASDDYVKAKASIESIRRYETRLGLELEDVRSGEPA